MPKRLGRNLKEVVILVETWEVQPEKDRLMTTGMSVIYSYTAAASKIQVKKEKKICAFFSLMKCVTVEFSILINYKMLFHPFILIVVPPASSLRHVNLPTKRASRDGNNNVFE